MNDVSTGWAVSHWNIWQSATYNQYDQPKFVFIETSQTWSHQLLQLSSSRNRLSSSPYTTQVVSWEGREDNRGAQNGEESTIHDSGTLYSLISHAILLHDSGTLYSLISKCTLINYVPASSSGPDNPQSKVIQIGRWLKCWNMWRAWRTLLRNIPTLSSEMSRGALLLLSMSWPTTILPTSFSHILSSYAKLCKRAEANRSLSLKAKVDVHSVLRVEISTCCCWDWS